MELFKNSKRVFALVLTFAIIAMSMFSGAVMSVSAEEAENGTVEGVLTSEGAIDLLTFGDYLTEAGSSSTYYDSVVADNGEAGDSWENAIIVDSAEEFVYLCKASGDDTKGKYYKVADGIAGFNLSTDALDLDGTLADNIDIVKGSGKNHAGNTPGFQGHFDGNGATVYGAWTNHNEGNITTYAGLFSCTKGEVTIKNINVNKAYFVGKNAAGGIVGYHKADDMCTVTIENCSVTDSYLEVLGTGYGHGVGAVIGYGASAPSYKDESGATVYVNVSYNIKNCYVNLDEANFISKAEDGVEDSGERVCHGGVAGVLGSNDLKVSDCVVIGIKPYATMEGTSANDVQHSGLESHFANVYTTENVAINPVNLGGSGALNNRNFTGKVFPLSDAKLKGAAAVDNMNLDWSVWMADDEGYPELRVSHKNVSTVSNNNGTHSATCACGFGNLPVNCTYADGKCSVCGFEVTCGTRQTIYWDGTVATGIATGSGEKNDPYIIRTAAEFAYVVKTGKADNTAGKYYKIDDGIGAIVLQSKDKAEAILGLKDAAAVKTYFESEAGLVKWVEMGWNATSFGGDFDGNGVTVYGLYSVSASNAGLFSAVQEGAAFHNIALKNSYLKSEAPQANYQVGGIAAVTAGSAAGAIWFDGCVVANNYMYNNSTSHDRSGVIIGSAQKMIYTDNCLVYGNDATYGADVVMPIIGSAHNSTIVGSSIIVPDGLELEYQENSNENGDAMYRNMVRNSIIFGNTPYDLAQVTGSRFNDPKCYKNVLTDADVATDTFGGTDKVLGATDEQLKTVTLFDLTTAELSDAWINTDSYPELKAFHDDVWTFGDNGDGTHGEACSCGLAKSSENHNYDETGKCTACEYQCLHGFDVDPEKGALEFVATIEGDCTTPAKGVLKCTICEMTDPEVIDDPAGAPGHTHGEPIRENVIESTCTTEGSCDTVVYCTVCDEEVSREATVIGINPDAHVYDDDKDATCNECGHERELFKYGDVNNDGLINNKDLGVLMQHLNEWDVEIVKAAADVNADGAVNNKDYGLLMQYLNEWDVTLGPVAE